ncbi:hypothetical protein O181_003032 [Austropuccinia psidii MF-1]|uniref:Uncharacterized protein n=1 Tax=Austropuccinia psidii MF-1 TaxID=1389203 RepID=A0A9Q3GEI6_9BASI|nr:hypothetical protein [Austropuccinia psidii MF-1]
MSDPSSIRSKKSIDLPSKFAELEVDDILSCAKAELPPSRESSYQTDVQLDDLDVKISAKLKEVQRKSSQLISKGTSGNGGTATWVLREEINSNPAVSKQRWLVARNEDNEVELTLDLSELEAKTDTN